MQSLHLPIDHTDCGHCTEANKIAGKRTNGGANCSLIAHSSTEKIVSDDSLQEYMCVLLVLCTDRHRLDERQFDCVPSLSAAACPARRLQAP